MSVFRETSTMISDLVLCLTTFFGGWMRMYHARTTTYRNAWIGWFGMFGFGFVVFASSLGTLRFGYLFPRYHHSLQGWHRYFSDLASVIGIPLLAAAYTQRTSWDDYGWLFMVLGIIGVLLHCIE